ncbi:MAG: DUF362 domain-containing protein [bacterium]
MKPTVFFIPVHNAQDTGKLSASFKLLLRKIPWKDIFPNNYIVAVKMHFGEKDNTGHIPAPIIKNLADKLKSSGIKPFITDTNVLYHGQRTNSVDHINLAREHGYSLQTCGAPVIIADGLFGENVFEIPFNGRHCRQLKTAGILKNLHGFVSAAHYTGHMVTGFGGTLKNIGMGFANRAGKQIQHSAIKPSVIEKSCTYCKKCIAVCPVQAIVAKNNNAFINEQTCIGCADCIVACQFKAIKITWEESFNNLEEKMVEYAAGIINHIPHTYFINFAVHITKECDCLAKDDPSIVDDIGILASRDPVALDKATLDLVLKEAGKDIFKIHHPDTDYQRQLDYASQIGLGSLEYKLEEIQ